MTSDIDKELEPDDSNEGDIWREHKKNRQEKRWSNVDQSLELLGQEGIEVETLNASIAHYRVDGWSFWPTTGKFFNPKTGESGRGVRNLINIIKNT